MIGGIERGQFDTTGEQARLVAFAGLYKSCIGLKSAISTHNPTSISGVEQIPKGFKLRVPTYWPHENIYTAEFGIPDDTSPALVLRARRAYIHPVSGRVTQASPISYTWKDEDVTKTLPYESPPGIPTAAIRILREDLDIAAHDINWTARLTRLFGDVTGLE